MHLALGLLLVLYPHYRHSDQKVREIDNGADEAEEERRIIVKGTDGDERE